MPNNGSKEQSGALPHQEHPTPNPVGELCQTLQARRDPYEEGVLVEKTPLGVAIIRSAKHAEVAPGQYIVTDVFPDGLGIEITVNKKTKTVFVETEGVESWERL